ncbi:hypothetical protein BGX24_010114 [Mortierella sp. AD032]|nr:hypothetical protein BGX24_010114 [Mortierella sp. AD032]
MPGQSTRHRSQQPAPRPFFDNNSSSDRSSVDEQTNESGNDQSNSSEEPSDGKFDNDTPEVYSRDLPAPESYTIQLHLRSGEPYTHCRSITNLPDPRPFQHTNDGSYGILYEIVRARALKNPDYLWQEDSGIYLKPSHNAPQKYFKEIDDSNYEVLLEDAWRMEGRRLGVLSSIVIHIYVYLQPKSEPDKVRVSKRARASSKKGQQPATRPRTIHELGRIRQEERSGRLPTRGPFKSAHLVRHLDRRPETVDEDHPIEIPGTNVFRQMEHLDREPDDLRPRRPQEREFAEEEFAL